MLLYFFLGLRTQPRARSILLIICGLGTARQAGAERLSEMRRQRQWQLHEWSALTCFPLFILLDDLRKLIDCLHDSEALQKLVALTGVSWCTGKQDPGVST